MLVFQYGSNISSERLNHEDRLRGDAKAISVVSTVKKFDIAFTVWSRTNNCAAADIVPNNKGRNIYGVLYEVPDYLIGRDSAKPDNRKSLDAIEGAGGNYERMEIAVILPDETEEFVTTYVVRERDFSLQTSREYAQHIINGLYEHNFPDDYRHYVVRKIEDNNPSLAGIFKV